MTSQIDVTKPVFGTPTTQSVRDNFTTAANEITTLQQQTTGSPFLSLQGGRMAGPMYLYNDPTDAMMPATKGYVDAGGGGGGGGIPEAPSQAGYTYGRSQGAWVEVLAIAGGTMTGPIELVADPTDALQPATKQYVDALKPTIIADAPNDAFFYGRHANAWAQVLALTGGQLSGALGVGQTLPANVNTNVVVAGTTAAGGYGVNTYQDTTGAWHYLTNGVGGAITGGTGGIGFYMAPTGAAGAAATWGAQLFFDYKGNIQMQGAPAIPVDCSNPTVNAVEHAVAASGHLTFNSYIGAGTWKYLANSYAGYMYVDASGRFSFALGPSGSAGGNITWNVPFIFDQAGSFTAPGTVAAANLSASNNIGGNASININGSVTAGGGIVAGASVGMGGTGSGFYLAANAGAGQWTLNFQPSQYIQFINGQGIAYVTGGVHTFNNNVNMSATLTVSGACTVGGLTVNSGTTFHNHCYCAADNTYWSGPPGNAWAAVGAYSFSQQSDPRNKENITPAPAGALDRVRAIPVYRFNYKSDEAKLPHTGFDASEVQAHHPDATVVGFDEEKTLGISLSDMVALLWQAVQELAAERKAA